MQVGQSTGTEQRLQLSLPSRAHLALLSGQPPPTAVTAVCSQPRAHMEVWWQPQHKAQRQMLLCRHSACSGGAAAICRELKATSDKPLV